PVASFVPQCWKYLVVMSPHVWLSVALQVFAVPSPVQFSDLQSEFFVHAAPASLPSAFVEQLSEKHSLSLAQTSPCSLRPVPGGGSVQKTTFGSPGLRADW